MKLNIALHTLTATRQQLIIGSSRMIGRGRATSQLIAILQIAGPHKS